MYVFIGRRFEHVGWKDGNQSLIGKGLKKVRKTVITGTLQGGEVGGRRWRKDDSGHRLSDF